MATVRARDESGLGSDSTGMKTYFRLERSTEYGQETP